MTTTGRPSRARARQRLRAGPGAWPTAIGAVVAFVLAAHEHLVWAQILGCVLAALLVVSVAGVALPARFTVRVEAPRRVVAGQKFDMGIGIRARVGLGRRGVVVRMRWRARDLKIPDIVAFVDAVSAREERIFRWTTPPLSRGVVDGFDIDIEIAGPFGLFSRFARESVSRRLLCVPAPAPAVELPTAQGVQVGTAAGLIPDADLRGVRDWRPGDQINQVHWRSVVRTGRMTVVDRDTRLAGTLAIVVIAPGKPARPGKSPRATRDAAFESALSVAAASAAVAMRNGATVCLTARREGAGYSHLADDAEMLDAFAGISVTAPPDDPTLEHLLSHAARGGAILVVGATAPVTALETVAACRARIAAAAAQVGATVIDVGVPPRKASA